MVIVIFFILQIYIVGMFKCMTQYMENTINMSQIYGIQFTKKNT